MTERHEKIEYNIKAKEVVHYEIYEGEKVVDRGTIGGNSFTSLGINRVAQMAAGLLEPATYKINAFEVKVATPTNSWYSTATVVSYWANSGAVTAETITFQSPGTYYHIAGKVSNEGGAAWASIYNILSPNVVLTTGQTVKFFVEYSFVGLGANTGPVAWTPTAGGVRVDGDRICAGLLFNTDGAAPGGAVTLCNAAIKWLAADCDNPQVMMSIPPPLNVSVVSNNTIWISGHTWTLANGQYMRGIYVMGSWQTPFVGTGHRIFGNWRSDGVPDTLHQPSGPTYIMNTTTSPVTVHTDFEFKFL